MKKRGMLFTATTVLFAAHLVACSGAADSERLDDGQPDPSELLFTRLFRRRRAEQIEAVREIRALGGADKRAKMSALVIERLFAVIAASKATLEAAGFVIGVSRFPEQDSPQLHALSNVLENVALFAELALRVPDAVSATAVTQHGATLRWAVASARDSRLLDAASEQLLGLMEQQLGVVDRDPDFVNPYVSPPSPAPAPTPGPHRVRKPRLPRRPRITPRHSEL